jgi:hypothetical protein
VYGANVEIIARIVSEVCKVFGFVFDSQSTKSLTTLTGKAETEINVSSSFSDVVMK